MAALGLAAFADRLWGVFLFGVMGLAVAWSLAALMFVLVSDGVPSAEHGRAFGLLHAAWSLAMIGGALLGGTLTPRRTRSAVPGGRSAQCRFGGGCNGVFARLDGVGTAGAGVRSGELDTAT